MQLKEGKKRDKTNWKTIEHKSDGDTNCNRCARHSHQKIGKETGRIGNKNTSGDYPNDSTAKISQNTEKSPGNLTRLVTQTPVKDHQLMLA